MGRERGGVIGIDVLSEQSADESTQNVAHPARSLAGVAGSVHEDRLVLLSDQGVGTFQQYGLARFVDRVTHGVKAVVLYFGSAKL
jgi:hypothetical protein